MKQEINLPKNNYVTYSALIEHNDLLLMVLLQQLSSSFDPFTVHNSN